MLRFAKGGLALWLMCVSLVAAEEALIAVSAPGKTLDPVASTLIDSIGANNFGFVR